MAASWAQAGSAVPAPANTEATVTEIRADLTPNGRRTLLRALVTGSDRTPVRHSGLLGKHPIHPRNELGLARRPITLTPLKLLPGIGGAAKRLRLQSDQVAIPWECDRAASSRFGQKPDTVPPHCPRKLAADILGDVFAFAEA